MLITGLASEMINHKGEKRYENSFQPLQMKRRCDCRICLGCMSGIPIINHPK